MSSSNATQQQGVNITAAGTVCYVGGKLWLNYHDVRLQISCGFLNASAVKWVERLNSLCDNCVLIGWDFITVVQLRVHTSVKAHVLPGAVCTEAV